MRNDKLIYSLSELDRVLVELNEIYNSFFQVILAEEEAITRSDLSKIEEIIPEKVACGGAIETSINKVSSIMQSLASEFAKDSKVPKGSDISLSNLVSILETIGGVKQDNEELDNKVLTHTIKKLKVGIDNMLQSHRDIYPKVEANKYLVDSLLENHRQTHRFWLSMISESQGTYGSKGAPTQQNLTSMISVKA